MWIFRILIFIVYEKNVSFLAALFAKMWSLTLIAIGICEYGPFIVGLIGLMALLF